MDIFTYILTTLLAIALVGAAIFLCFRRPPATAPTVIGVLSFGFLSFGFLMLLLLHTSKFKHVNGFGFDAETWDEKQVEAAKLIDQLSSISEGLSQEVALLASRIGLWDSGLTNPELAALLQKTNTQLQATTTLPQARRDEILAPIRLRISTNYWNAARNLIDKAYLDKGKELKRKLEASQRSQADLDAYSDGTTTLTKEATAIDAIPMPHMPFDLSILIDAVQKAKTPLAEATTMQLNELNEDLRFFNANNDNKLRRDINLEALYPSPHQFLMGN
jgi:hypothetical protein